MFRNSGRWVLLLVLATLTAPVCRGDIIWESEGFAPDQGISNGTSVSGATLSTSVYSDSDGGSFDLTPGGNATYFTYKSGEEGNHSGYLELSFNNTNDDPADYIELSLTFDTSVSDLQFSLLDVDRGVGGTFVDAVELTYNGINVRNNPAFYTLNPNVGLDNEPSMNGFEGLGSAAANQTLANVDFNFGGTLVDSLTIRFFTIDDAIGNPFSQSIGVSDLSFTPTSVPEPSAFIVLTAALIGLRYRSRRLR